MTRAAAAAILTAVVIVAIYETRQPTTVTEYQVEVIERTETVYTDLDDLREDFANLAEELKHECLYIIERQTGDPMAGIIHHIDRHYQGDACRAADEVLRGEW